MLKRAILENEKKLLVLLFLVSFGLRFIGIGHSFPEILHPDEPTIVRRALGVRFYINPGHFDWPHLYVYLNYFLFMAFARFRTVLEALGLKEILSPAFPLIWNDVLIYYYLTRVFSITLGALTTIPVYFSAKNLFNKKVAFFAALSFVLIPFHTWHSQYSLPDVPMVFFLAVSLYFSTNVFREGRIKDYLLAGLFVGFAASTKYNGALAALVVAFAHLLRTHSAKQLFNPKEFTKLLYAGMFSVVGFVIGTPYSILDYTHFLGSATPRGALWQFTNVGDVSLVEQITKFFSYFYTKLIDDFGYTILLGYLSVVLLFIRSIAKKFRGKYFRELFFITLPSVYFFYYIAGLEKSRSHYYFIVYPFVAILSGYFVAEVLPKFSKNKNISWLLKVLYFSIPFILIMSNNLKRLQG